MNSHFRDELRKIYDLQASQRDAAGIEEWKAGVRADFLSVLQREGKRRLLEIGSGPGRDGVFFLQAGLQVTCIDLSPEMVRLCREKGLTADVMDMTNLPFPAGSFDAVYALNSLLHLAKAELPGVLKRIDSVLAPEGVFFMGVYGGIESEGVREDGRNDPRFFSFFTDDHLREVVSRDFAIISFRQIPVPGENNRLHFQSLVLRKQSVSSGSKSLPV